MRKERCLLRSFFRSKIHREQPQLQAEMWWNSLTNWTELAPNKSTIFGGGQLLMAMWTRVKRNRIRDYGRAGLWTCINYSSYISLPLVGSVTSEWTCSPAEASMDAQITGHLEGLSFVDFSQITVQLFSISVVWIRFHREERNTIILPCHKATRSCLNWSCQKRIVSIEH